MPTKTHVLCECGKSKFSGFDERDAGPTDLQLFSKNHEFGFRRNIYDRNSQLMFYTITIFIIRKNTFSKVLLFVK